VNTFTLRLEQHAGVPWLRIRFEGLFCADTLKVLLAFAGIGASVGADASAQPPVDDYPFLVGCWSDPAVIARHPDVIDLAKLRRRYLGSREARA